MMLNNQHCRRVVHYFLTHRYARVACLQVVAMSALAVAVFAMLPGNMQGRALAQAACASGDTAYTVAAGDTLSTIAQRYQTNWQQLAQHNALANPNLIFAGQLICIPGKSSATHVNSSAQPQYSPAAAVGQFNSYPYGQCTWWADERYHQLHGVYVPWMYNSDAWQWTTRARQYGWHVSSKPTKGSIIVLQPWTQGAYGAGHVAIVETVLSGGRVIASNMNWGGSGAGVVNVTFHTGAGVSFITR